MQFICTHHQDVKIACNRTSETPRNRSLFLCYNNWSALCSLLSSFVQNHIPLLIYFNIVLRAKLTKALQMFKIHKIHIDTQVPSLSFYQLYKICTCKEQISDTCISSPHDQAISIHLFFFFFNFWQRFQWI